MGSAGSTSHGARHTGGPREQTVEPPEGRRASQTLPQHTTVEIAGMSSPSRQWYRTSHAWAYISISAEEGGGAHSAMLCTDVKAPSPGTAGQIDHAAASPPRKQT